MNSEDGEDGETVIRESHPERVVAVLAAIVLMMTACSRSATTQLTAEEPDPTAVIEVVEPTMVPTASPVSPSATPEPAPSPVPEVDEPDVAQTRRLIPSGANDSEALQAILDNVEATGGELRLGPGRFQIDDTLVVRLDVRIVGAGSDQTILERVDDGAIVNARNVSVELQDIGLVSTFVTEDDSRVPLLEIINSQVEISAIAIDDAPGTGVWIENSTGSVVSSTFTNSGWIGMWIVGDSDLTVTANTASRNGDGFLFDEATTTRLTENSATLNLGAGFWWLADSTGVAQANVAIQNDLGFLVDGNATPELFQNTAERNAEIGFAFRETSTPVVSENTALDSKQGFYADGEAAPTLTNNTATDNSEVGVAWYDESTGSASGTTYEGNGQDSFVEETASPVIDGEAPTASTPSETPTATPAPIETPVAPPVDGPSCPAGAALEGASCVRVVGSPQAVCSEGTLQGGSCVVQVRATPEQTCIAPYLLYSAESGDPTLPGFDGTCAWFDNGGICPAGDTYNPDAGGGDIFTHKCKRPPMVTYTCQSGTLANDVCEFQEAPVTSCPVGTLRGTDCVEVTDPS